MNDKVLKILLDSLKVHIKQGCLSDINPDCGTNRNENLHRSINPFFSRCRMGIRLAMALLTVLFHRHNQKLSPASTAISILSVRALYPRVSNSSTEEHTCFGIMKKTETPHIDDWIFGSQMPQRIPQLPSTEFVMSPELDDIVTFQDTSTLLQSSLNLMELAKTLQIQTQSSVMLNQRMIPFMSSVTCLFESVNVPVNGAQEHHKRLLDNINAWGFTLHPVSGDGNCCFSALANGVLFQHEEVLTRVPTLFSDLRIHSKDSVNDIARELRRLAVEEWVKQSRRLSGIP